MAKRRMIDGEFWEEPKVAKMSDSKRLFTIGCINEADDEGRLIAEPEYLRAIIWKYHNRRLGWVKKIRDEVCSELKGFQLYEVEGVFYIQLKNWERYQILRKDRIKESRFPPLDAKCQTNVSQLADKCRHKISKDKLREVKISKDIGDTKTVAVSKKIDFSKKQEKDYNARDLVAYFGKKFEEVIGWEYHANFGKDGKIMKDLATQYKPEGVLDLIEEFFDMAKENEWVADKLEIGVFKSMVNKLLIRMKKEKK